MKGQSNSAVCYGENVLPDVSLIKLYAITKFSDNCQTDGPV